MDVYGNINLVTCGKENIRFWRLRKEGWLSGRPVLLTEFCRGFEFTAICSHQDRYMKTATTAFTTFIYTASSKGIILKIEYLSGQIMNSFQLHDVPIRSMVINNHTNILITGADDGHLRVWPLMHTHISDSNPFTDYLLEAHFESSISSLTISADAEVISTCVYILILLLLSIY